MKELWAHPADGAVSGSQALLLTGTKFSKNKPPADI